MSIQQLLALLERVDALTEEAEATQEWIREFSAEMHSKLAEAERERDTYRRRTAELLTEAGRLQATIARVRALADGYPDCLDRFLGNPCDHPGCTLRDNLHHALADAGEALRVDRERVWDEAVAAMVYEDGTPVEVVTNTNPYARAEEARDD